MVQYQDRKSATKLDVENLKNNNMLRKGLRISPSLVPRLLLRNGDDFLFWDHFVVTKNDVTISWTLCEELVISGGWR